MKKRILAMLLSVIMLISVLPISASAVKVIASGNYGDNLTWQLDVDGTLTISGEGPMANLIDGDPDKTDIAWARYRADIKTVIIKDGVTSISDYSFWSCNNITEVNISASVSVIGDYVFEGCNNLQRFIVDKDNDYYCNDKFGLLYTKDMQLLKCVPYAIDEMILPEAILEIAYDAFSDGDTENVIKCTGDAITYYGTTMYDNTIYYPEDNPTWTEAIKGAFGSNTWIGYIPDVPIIVASGKCGDNLTWELTNSGTLIISGEGEMYDYETSWVQYDFEAVIIREGVTSIGNDAFNSKSIMNVSIPNTVTRIGRGAFGYCWDLNYIYIPDSVLEIDEEAFWGGLRYISVDEENPNYSSDDNGVLYNKEMNEIIHVPCGIGGEYTIPDSITHLDYGTFYLISNELESVTIPASVTSIDDGAFVKTSIGKIIVDEDNPNYSSDEHGALLNKDKTELIYVTQGVTGSYIVPSSVKSIKEYAFMDLGNLGAIEFTGDVPRVDSENIWWWEGITYFYPENNPTWTKEAMASFGEGLTWLPYIPYVPGDVDGDGEISNTDLIMVARYIVELRDENTIADIEQYGDMDGDEIITNTDLISIARIIVGLA